MLVIHRWFDLSILQLLDIRRHDAWIDGMSPCFQTISIQLTILWQVKRNARNILPGEGVWSFGQILALVMVVNCLSGILTFVLDLWSLACQPAPGESVSTPEEQNQSDSLSAEGPAISRISSFDMLTDFLNSNCSRGLASPWIYFRRALRTMHHSSSIPHSPHFTETRTSSYVAIYHDINIFY